MKYIPWKEWEPLKLNYETDEMEPRNERERGLYLYSCKWEFTDSKGQMRFHAIAHNYQRETAPSEEQQMKEWVLVMDEVAQAISKQTLADTKSESVVYNKSMN